MPVIGATAAAQHVDLRVLAHQVAILAAKLEGIAGIEIRRLVQLLMAAP